MGDLLIEVPANIGGLKFLNQLNLENNQLTSLPDEIGLLNNLHLLHLRGNPWEPPVTEYMKMHVEEVLAIMRRNIETPKPKQISNGTAQVGSEGSIRKPAGVNARASDAKPDGERGVQILYGHVIPKKGTSIMPCLSITTQRFWDEHERVPELEEWKNCYRPEEVEAIEHVVHVLQLGEIIEGIYEFITDTPGGKARMEKAETLWQDQKFDDLYTLHKEIVELDLKPALERLGAVESPEISEQLQGGYFSH
jgi:hypothetical protein